MKVPGWMGYVGAVGLGMLSSLAWRSMVVSSDDPPAAVAPDPEVELITQADLEVGRRAAQLGVRLTPEEWDQARVKLADEMRLRRPG